MDWYTVPASISMIALRPTSATYQMKLCHGVETLFGTANRAMGDAPVPSVRYIMPQGIIIFDVLISDD